MSMAWALLCYVTWCAVPVVVFGLIAAVLSPEDNRVKRLGGRMLLGLRRLRPRAERPVGGPDPFEVLSVQLRLDRLSAEIAALQAGARTTARAHHLRAALGAYDDLLETACRMARAPVPTAAPRSERRRLSEAELRSRAWL